MTEQTEVTKCVFLMIKRFIEDSNHFIFIAIFLLYIISSYLSNPPLKVFSWDVLGDVVLGLAISIIITFLIKGLVNGSKDNIPHAVLTGSVLTFIGMAIYGLLNNALEINLSTHRSTIGNDIPYHIVSLDIGLTKPKYTRARVLYIKVDVYKKQIHELKPDIIFYEDSLNRDISNKITEGINKMTMDFNIKENKILDVSKTNNGIFLVPGDKTSYSYPITVNKSEIVRFDVSILCQQGILGIPMRWSRPQWTSSTISFPSDSESKK